MTGHVFLGVSLDGFVARLDHRLDWLTKHAATGEDHGYNAFMAGVDGIIMGSGSLRTVLTFGEWPYRKPVIVMSGSLTPERHSPSAGRAGSRDRPWPAGVDAGAAPRGMVSAPTWMAAGSSSRSSGTG